MPAVVAGALPRLIRYPILFLLASLCGCSESGPVCSDAWYREVEAQIPTGDGQGHGPDPGSEEWRSVVEFKLGIRGQAGIPDRASDDWCRYMDAYLGSREQG